MLNCQSLYFFSNKNPSRRMRTGVSSTVSTPGPPPRFPKRALCCYDILPTNWYIGINTEITIKPTIPPIPTIMIGSNMEVKEESR